MFHKYKFYFNFYFLSNNISLFNIFLTYYYFKPFYDFNFNIINNYIYLINNTPSHNRAFQLWYYKYFIPNYYNII